MINLRVRKYARSTRYSLHTSTRENKGEREKSGERPFTLLTTACANQGCLMAKFDPFLSLDCARVEGVGAQSKERKGSNFAA